MKHFIWDDSYVPNVAWDRVAKFVKIKAYIAEALLKGFNQTWGDENSLCRRDRMKIMCIEWESRVYVNVCR